MKPILVARDELIHDIQDAITNSQLPAYILEPVMQQLLTDVRLAVREEYKAQMAEYEHQTETEQETTEN